MICDSLTQAHFAGRAPSLPWGSKWPFGEPQVSRNCRCLRELRTVPNPQPARNSSANTPVRWETYPSPAELQMRLKSQSQSFFVQISCGVITNKIVSLQCGYLIHVHIVKGFPHQVIISINSHVYLFWWEYLNYTITVLSTIFTKLYIRFSDLIHLLFIL